jgi:hypothetical protein
LPGIGSRHRYLNVARTMPRSPCEPHKISLTRHQVPARA